MENRVFTLDEVAKILRVDPRTIFRLIHGQNVEKKKLPATKIGRSWRITEADLKKFFTENANMENELQKVFVKSVRKARQKKK